MPADQIQIACALNGPANVLNYSDFVWQKYRVGEWAKVTDPATGKPQRPEVTIATPRINGDRIFFTSVSQSFNSGTTGPATTVARSYDSYGRIISENISVASNAFTSVSQSWSLAGRRSSLNLSSGLGLGFYYQADGLMTAR